jgi:hypothetical protein
LTEGTTAPATRATSAQLAVGASYYDPSVARVVVTQPGEFQAGGSVVSYTAKAEDAGKELWIRYSVPQPGDGLVCRGGIDNVQLQVTDAVPVNNPMTGGVTISNVSNPGLGIDVLRVGDTLSAGNTLADADGLGALSYVWLRNGQPIDGATNSVYTLGQADVGAAISVTVSQTDLFGATESKTSSPTSTILDLNEAPTDIALSNTRPQWYAAAGTTVGGFSTADPNPVDSFTYTLVSGTGSTDNGSFTIVGSVLKANVNLGTGSYAIRVRTTDAGGLFTEKPFTIATTPAVLTNLTNADRGVTSAQAYDTLSASVDSGIVDPNWYPVAYRWRRNGDIMPE